LVLFLLVISILVTYCIRNEEKEYLKEHIEKLYKKEIIFMDTLTMVANNELIEVGVSSLLGAEFTIVKRVEADCPKCIYDLQLFNEEIAAQLDKSVVKPVYIVYTGSFQYFKHNILPGITHISPLVIDTLNQFVLKNDLPWFDQRFHTFLLDSMQKIIMLGDPVNESTRELYEQYNIFSGER